MNIRSHHATNLSGDGNDSLLVEDIAAQLYRQETNKRTSWDRLGPAERNEWRARAEQYMRAVTSLGYRVDPAAQPHRTEENAARLAAREAENLLGMGEPLLAYNALQAALAEHPSDLRLRQLKGLALARSGALLRANELLSSLWDEGHTDGETLGLVVQVDRAHEVEGRVGVPVLEPGERGHVLGAQGRVRVLAELPGLGRPLFGDLGPPALGWIDGHHAAAALLPARRQEQSTEDEQERRRAADRRNAVLGGKRVVAHHPLGIPTTGTMLPW